MACSVAWVSSCAVESGGGTPADNGARQPTADARRSQACRRACPAHSIDAGACTCGHVSAPPVLREGGTAAWSGEAEGSGGPGTVCEFGTASLK